MSINIVKLQINKSLKSNIPEVVAISGAWGVGKTYTWNKLLKEAQASNQISLEKYAYVSLFGINSLKDFKDAIFVNTVNKNLIGKEANLETLKSNLLNISSVFDSSSVFGRKTFKFLNDIPAIQRFLPKNENIAFLSAYECLICIDDIERRGSNLDIENVLGLVSQLKEQKRCKIVLLLNDDCNGLEDYKKYHEKVVDIALKFTPSAAECAAIALDRESDMYVTLCECIEKLNITNIRILKKIERIVNLAQPHFHGYEDEIKRQFIHSLTLFTWCHFSAANSEVPTLDFVTNFGSDVYDFDESDDDSHEHKQWKTLLHNYGYRYADELDRVLAEAVRCGYFIDERVKQEVMKNNEQIIAKKSDNSFTEAWGLYHNSFENNQNEVIKGLYESFKHNARYISPDNLNGTVRLFRDLGESEKASELIDFYISTRNNEIDLFNPDEYKFFDCNPDEEILSKFNKAYLKLAKTENAKQVLERISGKNGWNTEDEVILANTSVDEYYNLFKTEKGPHLSSYVRTCLKFGQISGSNNEKRLEIMKRTQDALQKIAGESEINRRRVQKFGIEIKET